MEKWRAVPGYEGLYEVSNKGNVRNVSRNTLLRLPKTNKGYIQVGLYKNGIRNGLKVHRLVAQAFLPNPDNLPEVNHKDEDKTNNRVENLEWCNHKYNMNYGTRNIRRRETSINNGSWSGLSKEEYKKKWYQENKDRICEYKKEYYEKNKEKYREYMREYRKVYREKNKEKINEKNREYMREYSKRRKEKINKM